MNAVNNGDVSKVVEMVEAGMPVDITNEDGWTALIIAAIKNQTDVVRCLLDKGADVDKQHHRWGFTVLHIASGYNHTDVMRMLLQHGAIKDIKDEFGNPPIDHALRRNSEEAVDLLEHY